MEQTDTQEQLDALLAIEAQITEFAAGIRTHHAEMQQLDYDRDPAVLRKHLDIWLDWHLFAAEWLIKVRQERSVARAALRTAWQKVVSNQAISYELNSLPNSGSFEERKVVYEIKIDHRQRTVDVLDRITDTLIDFIRTIKTATEHWDKRRIDSKWEEDRRVRTPGADYESRPASG